MPPANPPEITLELSGGSLTIRTAEAIYRIFVTSGPPGAAPALVLPAPPAAGPALPRPAEAPALPEDDWDVPEASPASAPAPAAPGAPEDEEYYRELSHDMYREVGRLAKRLSMSIRDVKVPKMEALDFQSAGEQLEQAKDQLENVVKMTEQATLRIIDLGEAIQGAIDRARGIMERLSSPPAEQDQELEALAQARQELSQAISALTDFLGGLEPNPLAPLLEKAQALLRELEQAPAEAPPAPADPPPAPEAPPAAPAGPRFLFPLEVVFQTVYELCTNETVKKHIKAMWDAGAQAFDSGQVEEGLNAIAPEAPDQDNFLNLDLKSVLKTLFQATGQDRFQQVLKKMASTADQIFLEQTLPLEAMPAPQQAAPAPAAPAPAPAPAAPAPAAGPSPELLARAQDLVQDLEQAASTLVPPPLPSDLLAMLEKVLAAQVATCTQNVVHPEVLAELDQTMGVIFSSVNSIIEALSFQDLSGQTIYRIVRLLTDFQVQLLAMVVSFGSKLKAKASAKAITTEQSEKMAQEEVDKVLGTLGVHETTEEAEDAAKLDQDAVNNILQSMGF